ncbi:MULTISPECIES: hypothetical protein [unclassified Corynebacterium]|nr:MULTISPECIES: hypothetical protein [unclassified Corynebacterium]
MSAQPPFTADATLGTATTSQSHVSQARAVDYSTVTALAKLRG